MPTVPTSNECSMLACRATRSRLSTLCLSHGGIDNLPPRMSDKAYKSSAWKSIRLRQLSTQPLCQGCLTRGHIASAEIVDHVWPWKQLGKYAFALNEFQSLCKACHSHKTAKEGQGVVEWYRPDGVHIHTIDDYWQAMSLNSYTG